MNRVPKLRFPGFSGEWEEKKLGEIGKVSMCKRIMKEQTTLEGDIPFYKIGTFGKEADAFISDEIFKEYKTKYSFPKKGDILISASGTIGRTVIYDGFPAYFQDSNIVWIDNSEKIITNKFLFFLYKNIKWTTEDTTIARLYNNNLMGMEVRFPSLPEQQEIASFLSTVDSKKEKLERKKELWEQYKKGMMQKIFSQELRFKDENGEYYPEWEEKSLGEITLLLKDGTHGTHQNIESGISLLSAKDIKNKTIQLPNDARKISKDDFKKIHKNYSLKNGDIVLTLVGTIGETAIIENYEDNYTFQRSVGIIRVNTDIIYNKYLYQTLETNYLKKQLLNKANSSAQAGVYLGALALLQIPLPSLQEQTKIADFLSSIDSKIEIVGKELDGMKEFKKGLLQQMFV